MILDQRAVCNKPVGESEYIASRASNDSFNL